MCRTGSPEVWLLSSSAGLGFGDSGPQQALRILRNEQEQKFFKVVFSLVISGMLKEHRIGKENHLGFSFYMDGLDFIPEHTMWVGVETAIAAIVADGENRTWASLRGHSVFCWWAIGVYGYSKCLFFFIVALFMVRSWHSIESRCPGDKASKTEHNKAVSIYEQECIYVCI